MNQHEIIKPDDPIFPKSRKDLQPFLGSCLHAGRSKAQADVYRLTGELEGWLLKDFSGRPLWARLLMTRRALAREYCALKANQHIDGVPRLATVMPDKDAIYIEYLAADRLPRRRHNFLTPEFFLEAGQMIEDMHRRGWAHGDLRRKNILVFNESHRPCLIDFATAWHASPGAGALRRLLFRRWAQVDLITLIRIKQSYFPEAITAEENHILDSAPLFLRIGRWIRKNIYRPLKPRNRKKIWKKSVAILKGRKS